MQTKKKNKKIGFGERFYRKIAKPKGLISFEVSVKETDLWISAEKELIKEAETLVLDARHQIESYIELHPDFLTSLCPWQYDALAPPVVKDMINGSKKANVGPMASVAGAIAEYVGKGLLKYTTQVIVENGGDIFVKLERELNVSVFSTSHYDIGIIIKKDMMPIGICSSSGKIGHSLSFGCSDIVCVTSSSTSIADAAATYIANRIKKDEDIKKIEKWASYIKSIKGVLAIVNDNISVWGEIELTLI